MQVSEFQGEYRWLSNFWPAPVTDELGIVYPTVENAYQAAKIVDKEARRQIATMKPGQSKRYARKLDLRPDWEEVKVTVMEMFLKQKFTIPELREKLLETKGMKLVEGNRWGDTFWGVCKGKGQNVLGKLLMQIRVSLQQQFAPKIVIPVNDGYGTLEAFKEEFPGVLEDGTK